MAETRSQPLLKEVMMNETEEVLESRLDNLKETIDDHNAKIGERIHALLLLLRSEKREEENLHVHAYSASSQLPESPDFNRPEPKPNYVIKATSDVTEASSPLPNHTIKFHQRISLKEIEERRLKGLCVFCEESETPYHYLRHKNSGILMIDSEDHLSNSMVKEIGIEISSERWLSSSIDCELETGEIDSDEDQVPSDSDLVVNDIEKVKKDLVAINVDGETDSLIENNQKFQEEAKNRSTNSVLQPSLVPQMCSLLKEQVHEAQEENSRVENHKNWVQHVLLEEDSTIHLHEPVSKSENLRKMEVNSVLDNREVVMGVVERIRQVTSVTKNFSTRQLFGKKLKDKGRLRWKKRRKALKSWRFKFKNRDLRGYKLSIVKLLLKNSLVVTGFWWWWMLEHANMDAERHCYQRSQYIRNRWSEQQVEKLRIFIDIVGEVLFQHSHGISNRLHRKDLQDLQQFITLGEVKFQIKHKWKFKGKGREVREELSHLTSKETI